MTNLREVWEAISTELHDRLDLEGEERGEGVSGMLPKFLACEAVWMMPPFTDSGTRGRAGLNTLRQVQMNSRCLSRSRALGVLSSLPESVVHHSGFCPLNS